LVDTSEEGEELGTMLPFRSKARSTASSSLKSIRPQIPHRVHSSPRHVKMHASFHAFITRTGALCGLALADTEARPVQNPTSSRTLAATLEDGRVC
jgi:hypothetical protein